MGVGLGTQGSDHLDHVLAQCADLPAKVHADERGDLVIAAAAGPQAATQHGADALGQDALQRAVDILIGRCRSQLAAVDSSSMPRSAASICS